MSNIRDNAPIYDLEELQRQHDKYKARKQQEMLKKASAAEAKAEPAAEEAKAAPATEKPAANPEIIVEPRQPEETFVEEDTPEDFDIDFEEDMPSEDYEGDGYAENAAVSDENGADEAPRQNPNPFDSLFKVAAALKSKFSRKKNAAYEGDEAYPDYEEEFSEENLPTDDVMTEDPDTAGAYIPEDDYVEEAPAPRRRFGFRRAAAPIVEEDLAEDASEDVPVDIPEDVVGYDEAAPVYAEDAPAYDVGYEDDGYAEESYEDYPEEEYSDGEYGDEEYGDEFEEAPAPRKIGKFGKFIRLFVVPVDEDALLPADEEGLDEEVYPEYSEDPEHYYPIAPEVDAHSMEEPEQPCHDSEDAEDVIEGGLDNMADLNRSNPELSRALAADLDKPGMTRRERRELAERKAAEEAARKAVEEPSFDDVEAEAPKAEEPETISDLFADEPLEADVVKDVSSGIVEIEEASADEIPVVDEQPTREFKPVSKMSFDEFIDTVEEEAAAEEEDAAEEEEETPVRKGLFGRRSKKVVEEDEYDDEEEYDDEYDDEEEEEEEKPRRRGLFGRRKARKVEEEEEDEYDDEYDDEEEEEEEPRRRGRRDRYDDEEEYDDEYDDAYDDEEYYDDEDEDDYEGGSSFGRSILRFFIVIISLVLILAIVLLGANILNVIDVISLKPLADRMPEKVADILLFSEETKNLLSAEEDAAGVVESNISEITLEDAEADESITADVADTADVVEAADEADTTETEDTAVTGTVPTVG